MRKSLTIIFLLLPLTLYGNNFHIFTGPYKPDMKIIAPDNSSLTYQDFYGKSSPYLTIIHVDFSLLRNYGELSILGESGFFMDRGRALMEVNNRYESSGEDLTMYIIPVNIGISYYFHYIDNQVFVPFVEGGGSYWVFDEKKEMGEFTSGAKKGYFYGGGIKFLMDILEPSAATTLRIDYGINHTYIIGGYRVYNINHPSGFDFSDKTWYVGLSFNF